MSDFRLNYSVCTKIFEFLILENMVIAVWISIQIHSLRYEVYSAGLVATVFDL